MPGSPATEFWVCVVHCALLALLGHSVPCLTMAASSSKPSPSHQSVETSSSVPQAAASPNGTVHKDTLLPAATDDDGSDDDLLLPPLTYEGTQQSDYYVTAMSFLKAGDFEEALSVIQEGLDAVLSRVPPTEDESLHESLAPLHYLYGTTLLYSVEESSTTSMTNHIPESAGSSSSDDDDGGAGVGVDEDTVDDMQIAWENLETARMIIESMPNPTSKIMVDLAAVYLRTGDMHRLNGRYEAAAVDYSSCLAHLEHNIGPYDRKLADAHYNLGLCYMLQVAETRAPEGDASMGAEIKKRLDFLRSRGFHHSLQCGKTLCGQVAFLCNLEPEELFQKAEKDVPNFKSTGEEEEDVDHPKIASLKLQSLRNHVAALVPPAEHIEQVKDICELLNEIQETIDEAEKSEEGVQEVVDMKAAISAAVAEAAAKDEAGEPSNPFGSASAAVSTTVAQPIMAVRKKQKRDADDAKVPARPDDAKRPHPSAE